MRVPRVWSSRVKRIPPQSQLVGVKSRRDGDHVRLHAGEVLFHHLSVFRPVFGLRVQYGRVALVPQDVHGAVPIMKVEVQVVEVIGVRLLGRLPRGANATDLVLRIAQALLDRGGVHPRLLSPRG
uniref:Uncharacterized protein n=1 Tax=Desulfacinum infernum TaxID=35837 RepID=A0A832A4Q2_9BACT